MRGPPRRRLADLLRVLEEALDQRPLARLDAAPVGSGIGPGGGRLGRVAGLAQDAGDAGVRVLDVVDRVLARLAAGQVEVQVEGGFVAALTMK